jgi:hypothetical protein
MIPRASRWADLSTVKPAVSLEAVLRRLPGARLASPPRSLQGGCPIHHGQRDDSFRAHLTKNVCPCFACQVHGNVLDFVAVMEQCSIREAALRLPQWFGVARRSVHREHGRIERLRTCRTGNWFGKKKIRNARGQLAAYAGDWCTCNRPIVATVLLNRDFRFGIRGSLMG